MQHYTTCFYKIIVGLLISMSAIAGNLAAPEFNQAESTWRSFNNKTYKICKIKNKKRKPKKIIKKVKIHFENDLYEIGPKERKKIISGFKNHFLPKVKHIEVDAHADVKGQSFYNLKLSNQRLNAVINVINEEKLITHSTNLKTKYFGESESTQHHRQDRFVEIRFIHYKPTTYDIKRIYLVDGSASMKSRRTVSGYTFDDLRNMDIPKDTIVYVVRDNFVGCEGEEISNYFPSGRTYVKEAMGLFAYYMRGKIKFVTFTDGLEDLPIGQEAQINQFINKSKVEHKIKWYLR